MVVKRLYNNFIKCEILNKKFRKKNKHNLISFNYVNCIDNIVAGNCSYGVINLIDFKEGLKLYIGNCCSFGKNLTICLGGEHRYDSLSSFPFQSFVNGSIRNKAKGDIVIDDDVWIGINVTILSGVHISRGTIIAAGSVVTKDTEPYGIYGGVPARLIKKRFSDDIIKKISQIDYKKIDYNNISKCSELLEETATIDNIDGLMEKLSNLGILKD